VEERTDAVGKGSRERSEHELPNAAVLPATDCEPRGERPSAEQRHRGDDERDEDGVGAEQVRKQWQERPETEADQRRDGRGPRAGQLGGVDAEFLLRVDQQGLVGVARQLLGDFLGRLRVDPAGYVGLRELGLLGRRVVDDLVALDRQFGVRRLILALDLDLLAGRHREGTADEPGPARE